MYLKIVISCGLLVFIQLQLFAGAWVQQKGGYYLKFSSNYLYTREEFNHEGKKLELFEENLAFENVSFSDLSFIAYLEYGLLNRLTLISNLSYKILTSKRTEIVGGDIVARILRLHTTGLSDLLVSLRLSIWESPFVFSIQGGLKIPLGYEEKPSNEGAPLGTGKLDGEAHLLLGKSLYPLPGYVTAGLGYRQRKGPLHDQILFIAEVGANIANFLLKVTVDGIKSTIDPPDLAGQTVINPLPGGGGTFPNFIVGDQDIYKISPSLIFDFKEGFAMQGEIIHIFAGKNTVAGTIYSLGFVFFQ